MKTTRKCLFLIGASACGALLLNCAFAQTAPKASPAATRVAVCNLFRVFNNYERTLEYHANQKIRQKKIAAETEERKKAIDAISKEMKGYMEGSAQYEKKMQEKQSLAIRLNGWLELRELEERRKYHLAMNAVYEDILKAVADEAKARGYDLVLSVDPALPTRNSKELATKMATRKVLYSNPRIDITTMVLTRLNRP